jgi:transglutaminase-like putative cysteine protease
MTGADVTVLGPRRWAATPGARASHADWPVLELATFGALALYAAIRWSTLMHSPPIWRLIGLAAVATAVAAIGTILTGPLRKIAWLAALLGIIAIFPIAGIPLSWVRHVRLAVTADAINQGLSALPNALVPYLGINQWVQMVIVLGAGVLLIDAALLAAFAPRSLGDLRRAGAALPLIALAVVPMTLVKPQLPYLQGLILFALLAAFMWAERAPTRDAATAVAAVGLAGLGAFLAAPRVDPHHAWVNYRGLAGGLIPARIDTFNWSQTYGPLVWPAHGTAVIEVHAARPEYWKAEDLDVFDGIVWTTGNVGPPPPAETISPAVRKQWTQTIQVTIRAMRTGDVIAAGDAAAPAHVPQGVLPGISPGTWTAGALLEPGDSYVVRTYSPHPTPAQLAAAGTNYPADLLPGFVSIEIPGFFRVGLGHVTRETALFPPFGTPAVTAYGPTGNVAHTFLRQSPYAAAYALATRLKAESATPYAYIERVMAYLSHGFAYNTNPSLSRYPLESFLFTTKLGYCQQFAGAMALLLRMGGVPARVAVGFTTGKYNSATHEWVVQDTDAHAWVEAYFPGYGWVRFDPTPAAPAIPPGGDASTAGKHLPGAAGRPGAHGLGRAGGASSLGHGGGSSIPVLPVIAALAVLAGVALLALPLREPLRERSSEELLAELERALRRCGRPIAAGMTLAALEQRYRSSEGAAAYLRALRLARYGGASGPPTTTDRRALRTQLAAGLGFGGRLRALWALPPRR